MLLVGVLEWHLEWIVTLTGALWLSNAVRVKSAGCHLWMAISSEILPLWEK